MADQSMSTVSFVCLCPPLQNDCRKKAPAAIVQNLLSGNISHTWTTSLFVVFVLGVQDHALCNKHWIDAFKRGICAPAAFSKFPKPLCFLRILTMFSIDDATTSRKLHSCHMANFTGCPKHFFPRTAALFIKRPEGDCPVC